MICRSCGSDFSEQLPMCPYCAAPREAEERPENEKPRKSAKELGGEIAVAAIAKAGAAGEIISENIGGLAAKTKVQAEATGNSIVEAARETAVSLKDKFDDAGGFEGVADRLKRLLFFIMRAVRIIARLLVQLTRFVIKILSFAVFSVVQEFRDNYDSPKFWVYIGIVAALIIIIILK